jgi:hypothetical protein
VVDRGREARAIAQAAPAFALLLYVSPGSGPSLEARRILEELVRQFDSAHVRLEVKEVSPELPKVEADRIGFTPTLLLSRAGEAPERITGDLADADHVAQSLREAGLPPKTD